MASKCSTGKYTSGRNQPPSHEMKLVDFSGRYSPHIPSQSTPDPTYTSSPKTPNPNPYYSLNKELHDVTPEYLVYHIPNNEVDQLHCHTQTYLQSIGQIPIIYQIPRSHASHRRTQPYGEDETLTSSIYDLIINTIFEIRKLIVVIDHSETKEDPESQNLLNFPEGDPTSYDFQESSSRWFWTP